MTHSYTVGQRIRMVQMAPDPAPIEPGTEGTITRVTTGLYDSVQLGVTWDNSRHLAVILPDDQIEPIPSKSGE